MSVRAPLGSPLWGRKRVAIASGGGDGGTRQLSTAVRQDGRSASLTAPNGQAQQALLRAALADAGVPADAVTRLEAHGTGTALGDPIEMGSAVGVYLPSRAGAQRPHGLTRHATRLRTGPEILTPWFWSPVCQPVLQ